MSGFAHSQPKASPIPVAVSMVDMKKLHHMFHEAAWWRVQAMSSKIVSTDAIEQSWRTVVMYSVAPLTALWRPQVESVENTVPDAKIDHNVRILTQQMRDQYLEYLNTRGPAAAQMYLHDMEAERARARDQVLGMYRSVTQHDLQLAQEAERVRKSLVAVLTVCEVSMAVVGCLITFGVGGPVIVGGAMAGLQAAGTATVYGVLAEAVKDKPDRLHAIGASLGYSAGEQGAGVVQDVADKRADAAVELRKTFYESAAAKVKELQGRILTSRNPFTKGLAKAEIVPARWQLTRAGQVLTKAEAGAERIKSFAKPLQGVAVIFAANDIVKALKDGQENWNE